MDQLPEPETKIMVHSATTSLGGGVASFFLVCIPVIGIYFAMAAGLGGLIMGIQAIRVVNSDPATYKGTGVAIAGIIVSSISILVFWGLFLLQVLGVASGLLGG